MGVVVMVIKRSYDHSGDGGHMVIWVQWIWWSYGQLIFMRRSLALSFEHKQWRMA